MIARCSAGRGLRRSSSRRLFLNRKSNTEEGYHPSLPSNPSRTTAARRGSPTGSRPRSASRSNEQLAQPADAVEDLRDAGAAIAEDQAGAGGLAEIAGRERHRPQTLARGLLGELAVTDALSQDHRQVHPRPLAEHLDLRAQLAPQRL